MNTDCVVIDSAFKLAFSIEEVEDFSTVSQFLTVDELHSYEDVMVESALSGGLAFLQSGSHEDIRTEYQRGLAMWADRISFERKSELLLSIYGGQLASVIVATGVMLS